MIPQHLQGIAYYKAIVKLGDLRRNRYLPNVGKGGKYMFPIRNQK